MHMFYIVMKIIQPFVANQLHSTKIA